MSLSDSKKFKCKDLLDSWGDTESSDFVDLGTPYDWRSAALKRLYDKDVDGMKVEAAPLAEFKVLELMQYSIDEKVQLDAAKFILSQTGHGQVQQINHNIAYEKMDENQLVAMLQSKLQQLQRLAPGVSLDRLLSAPVDADLVSEDDEVDRVKEFEEV